MEKQISDKLIFNLQKDFEGMVAEIEQEQQEILKENKHANTN